VRRKQGEKQKRREGTKETGNRGRPGGGKKRRKKTEKVKCKEEKSNEIESRTEKRAE